MLRPPPHSALIQDARAIAEQVLPASVLAHCSRVFLLAREYAATRQIRFDEEGLSIAAWLHDLGLSDTLCDPSLAFPSVGARRLRRLFEERGEPRERAELLACAIELHMRFFPRWSRGPEVGLLHVGAWMDVTGRAKRHVPAEMRAEIARQHARGDLDREFPRRVRRTLGSWRACTVLFTP